MPKIARSHFIDAQVAVIKETAADWFPPSVTSIPVFSITSSKPAMIAALERITPMLQIIPENFSARFLQL